MQWQGALLQFRPSLKKITLTVLAVFVLITVIIVGQPNLKRNAPTNPKTDKVASLTTQLIKETTKQKGKGAEEKKIIEIAQKRKAELLKLIKEDPVLFLENRLSGETRSQLTSEAQKLVEGDIQVTGELSVIHYDNFDENKSDEEYHLETSQVTYNVHFVDRPVPINTYGQYTVTGLGLDSEIVLPNANSGNVVMVKGNEQNVLAATTPLKVMVMMVDYQNKSGTGYFLRKAIENQLIGPRNEIATFFKESTYDQVSVESIDVLGWYTIPKDYTGGCPYREMMNAGFDIAESQYGIDKNSYNFWVIVFPEMECRSQGGILAAGFYNSSIPNTTFINGLQAARTFEHEMGHAFSLSHAGSVTCEYPISTYDKCTESAEYGDNIYDVMGGGLFQFNAVHKLQGGWLTGSDIQTVTQSGIYTLAPLEETSGVRALKIHRPESTDDYFIEYRQPIGIIDRNLKPENTKGIIIYTANGRIRPPLAVDSSVTRLIKNAPNPLSEGEIFHDRVELITIKQISPDNSPNATVEITLGDPGANSCDLPPPPSVAYDCSNSRKCFNDLDINRIRCTVVPKVNDDGSHFHCDYDNFKDECKDLGTGWVGTSGCGSRSNPNNQVFVNLGCGGIGQNKQCWSIDYRDESTQCQWTHVYGLGTIGTLGQPSRAICYTAESCENVVRPSLDSLLPPAGVTPVPSEEASLDEGNGGFFQPITDFFGSLYQDVDNVVEILPDTEVSTPEESAPVEEQPQPEEEAQPSEEQAPSGECNPDLDWLPFYTCPQPEEEQPPPEEEPQPEEESLPEEPQPEEGADPLCDVWGLGWLPSCPQEEVPPEEVPPGEEPQSEEVSPDDSGFGEIIEEERQVAWLIINGEQIYPNAFYDVPVHLDGIEGQAQSFAETIEVHYTNGDVEYPTLYINYNPDQPVYEEQYEQGQEQQEQEQAVCQTDDDFREFAYCDPNRCGWEMWRCPDMPDEQGVNPWSYENPYGDCAQPGGPNPAC